MAESNSGSDDLRGTAGTVTGSDNGLVGSEFAEVAINVDNGANGPRLRVEDMRTGRVRYLDALELETLVWLPQDALDNLLDPSAHRWREDVGR